MMNEQEEQDIEALQTMICSLRLQIRRVQAMADCTLREVIDTNSDRESGWRRAA